LNGNDAGPPPRLSNGVLAGTALSLRRAVLNLVKFTHLSLGEAVQTASLNPARALGLERDFGSLEPGKWADVVLMDRNFNVELTMAGGEIVHVRHHRLYR